MKIPKTNKKLKVKSKKGMLTSFISGLAFIALTLAAFFSQTMGVDVPPDVIEELIPLATPVPGTETEYTTIVTEVPVAVSQWAKDLAFLVPWIGSLLISLGAFLRSVGLVPKDD